MENKNKKIMLFLLIIFIVSTLSLVIYITYDKILKADSNKDTSNTLDTKKDSETISEPRTYRFFGYTVDSFEDMYTTLKLYSDGKYTFYTNECEYIGKNSGNYSETDSKIQLSGDMNISLNKRDNGNYLEFDAEEAGACVCTSNTFALESYILNYVPDNNYDDFDE